MRRRVLPALAAAVLVASVGACSTREPGPTASGDPIVVGSTLPLTGGLGPTGIIHQIAGEVFVDRLNRSGGLLGRRVVWKLIDDKSVIADVDGLYEQLITQDKVDLIIGPYATPNILAAQTAAQRHGYVLPHHTAVLRPALTYPCQFPGWSIGPNPNRFIPEQLFDAVATLPDPPQRIAVLTSLNGSAAFVTNGFANDPTGVRSVADDRGLEIVLDEQYPFPSPTDWEPLARQVIAADPDLLVSNSLGVDTAQLLTTMKALGYTPPLVFSLFPAPGPLLAAGDGILAWSLFESNDELVQRLDPSAAEIVAEFESRAAAAGVPYTTFETQAAASWNAWEILVEGVKGANSLDHQAICDYLHANGAKTTFSGQLTFDPAKNNFWDTKMGIKQIQNGEWVMVWPADQAAAPIRRPTG